MMETKNGNQNVNGPTDRQADVGHFNRIGGVGYMQPAQLKCCVDHVKLLFYNEDKLYRRKKLIKLEQG